MSEMMSSNDPLIERTPRSHAAIFLALAALILANAGNSQAATAAQDSSGSEAAGQAVDAESRERDEQKRRRIVKAVSRANPVAATGQTARWVARQRQFNLLGVPYGFTGLPIVFPSANTGFNYGFKANLVDYRRMPYRYKATVYWVKSTEGRYSYTVRLKVPRISGTGFGVRLQATSSKDIRARYYGLSNDSVNNEDFFRDPEHADFIDENYYHYVLSLPRFIFSLLRHIYGPVSMSVGFGLEQTDVDPRGSRSFYEDEERGDLIIDGVTGFLSATVDYDSRDDPTIPKTGTFHEWSYETSRNSVLGLFFEEIDFQRYTFTDARYFPLSVRLNLAHRTIFEALKGSVPLYAYGEIGGSRRKKGLGGNDSLRGFDRQRFTDNIRLFTNTELRYQLQKTRAFRQYLEWNAAVFIDAGEVAPGVADLAVGELRWTGGFGLRLYWNSDFVIRSDVAFSSEQMGWNLSYSNVF